MPHWLVFSPILSAVTRSHFMCFYFKKKKIQPKEKSSSVTKYTIIAPRTHFNIINMRLLYSIQTVQLLSLPIPFPLLSLGDVTCRL